MKECKPCKSKQNWNWKSVIAEIGWLQVWLDSAVKQCHRCASSQMSFEGMDKEALVPVLGGTLLGSKEEQMMDTQHHGEVPNTLCWAKEGYLRKPHAVQVHLRNTKSNQRDEEHTGDCQTEGTGKSLTIKILIKGIGRGVDGALLCPDHADAYTTLGICQKLTALYTKKSEMHWK